MSDTTAAAVTVEQLRAWTAKTDLRLRGAREQLTRARHNLAALSRSERRGRAGASLVGMIETNGAIVAQLEVTMATVREQLGMTEADAEQFTSWEDLTGCECERKPTGDGLVAVTWNPRCPLHGFGASR